MRTLDPRKWRFKPPVWLVFILKQTVGRVYSALNFRPEEDIGIARHTLARMEHRFGRDNRITVNGMESLARRLGDDGQPDEAADLLGEVVRRRTLALGPDNIEVLKSKVLLGEMLTDLKRQAEAEKTLDGAVAGLQGTLGPEDDTTVSASESLALSIAHRRDYPRALELQRRVVEVRSKQYGPEHPLSLSARLRLAILLHWAEEDAEAQLLAQRVLDAKTHLEVDDRTTEKARELLAAIDRTGNVD